MPTVQEIAGKTRGGSAAKKIQSAPPPSAAGASQQRGPIAGGVLQKEDDGTYEQVPTGNGTYEWKKVADAAGNPVGDALELARRRAGQSAAGQTVAGPSPSYNPGPAQDAITDQKQNDIISQILGNSQQNQADNRNFVDQQVVPSLNAQREAAGAATGYDLAALTGQQQARDRAVGKNNALVAEQRANASNYNSQGAQMFNEYSAGQNALNQQDQGNLSRYMSETDPLMNQLTARGSNPQDIANQQAALARATGIAGGSLNYTAAQAASNAGDVARQNQSFGKLDAIGGGSLDYDAQLWTSNPEDEQRQVDAYSNFDRIGNGKLDYTSEGGKAYANPEDLANQRAAFADIQNEVGFGGAKQQESYDLIKGRTGVGPTDQETLLYELARRNQASQEKSSRDAVAERQASQGLRSGAAANAAARASSQQNSENALLSGLAANAGAVQRAQAYTGMQADQANAMRSSQQNALGLQGNMATTMRGQGFDESYKRGIAKDAASANNQGTQLAGYQLAGNQANQIRQSNDTVGLTNAGYTNQARANNQSTRLTGNVQAANVATSMRNASDNMSMFNTGQTNQAYQNNQATMFGGAQLQANQSNAIRTANDDMSQFQDMYAQAEAARVGGLAGQRSAENRATTNQVGTRNDATYGAGTSMLDTNYGRDKDSIVLDTAANTGPGGQYDMDSDVNSLLGQTGANYYNRAAGLTGSATGVATARSGIQQTDDAALRSALMLGYGQYDAEAAKRAINTGR